MKTTRPTLRNNSTLRSLMSILGGFVTVLVLMPPTVWGVTWLTAGQNPGAVLILASSLFSLLAPAFFGGCVVGRFAPGEPMIHGSAFALLLPLAALLSGPLAEGSGTGANLVMATCIGFPGILAGAWVGAKTRPNKVTRP
jgi:hypothetical protein